MILTYANGDELRITFDIGMGMYSFSSKKICFPQDHPIYIELQSVQNQVRIKYPTVMYFG